MSLVRNIAGIETTATGYTYSGRVLNSTTGEAIPNATISLSAPVALLPQKTIADSNGYFSLNTTIAPGSNVYVEISSAGYQTAVFPASQYQNVFELEPNIITLPDVVVTSENKFPWWIVLAAAPFVLKKQKKVGKVETGTVIAIGAGLFLLKGFGLFNDLLEAVGLQDSEETKALDASASNPASPWSPNFWKSGPTGTFLLTAAAMENMLSDLKSAFGWFNDDEAKAIAVFKQLKTQSQLSFFSDWFKLKEGADLLYWLRGTGYPNDRLSDAETQQINAFILKLPKYYA